jgi:hypothetical protein
MEQRHILSQQLIADALGRFTTTRLVLFFSSSYR